MSQDIEPFEIHFDDSAIEDLRDRLARTRFPDQIEGVEWDYGTELEYLKQLVEYWRDKFDWRAREAELNRFEHFRTTIDGQSIHFLHAPAANSDALPIVISHGWPGTVVEFLDVIEPLRNPEAHGGRPEDAFHVVCPSLPGYGFSEPTRSRGWNTRRIAAAFAELMARLGYSRYGAQGGDWGALITSDIARMDPEHVCGIHLNMPLGQPAPDGPELTPQEQQDLADLGSFQERETGYQRIQGTKPQTLGYGLNDSPAGLAAWIVEKFRTWSDCDGDVERSFTRDQLLTNISIYWFTRTITSSTRLYYEVMGTGAAGAAPSAERIELPTGVARFPKEILRFPRSWVERSYNVTHWSDFERGGHFAAMEEPELYVNDLRRFFGTLR